MKVRIREVENGWVSEIQKQSFLFKKWIPFITISGINDRHWIFKSQSACYRETVIELKQLITITYL